MTEFLVIRLNHDGDPEWTLVDETGAQLARPRRTALEAAAESAAGRKVIVLLPALDVLRTSTELPVRSGARLLQALPYAMEDQLAEDVERLHFAAGRRDQAGRVPAAIIDDERMAGVLATCRGAGLTPAAVYSEGEALGDIPGTNILLLEAGYGVLRHEDGSLTAVDHESLRPALELWLASRRSRSATEPAVPVNLLVYLSDQGADRHLELLEWLRDEVEGLDEKLLADGPLPRMASQIVTSPGINLLQGAYASRSDLAVHWPAWRIAAMLLIGLVGSILAVKAGELYQLNRESAELDSAIEKAFRFTFPEVGEIRDPRALLDSKLRGLTRSDTRDSGAPFLEILDRVAKSLAETDAVEFESISFRAGVMDLRVRAANVEALDRIQKGVTGDNLVAEIQSANADDNRVIGRLQIKAR